MWLENESTRLCKQYSPQETITSITKATADHFPCVLHVSFNCLFILPAQLQNIISLTTLSKDKLIDIIESAREWSKAYSRIQTES